MERCNKSLEVENARNLTVEQLAQTFVPTRLFDQLLSTKHHVLLGARGQGKTAICRMLSFEGLCRLGREDCKVREMLKQRLFIGIYLPTKLEWIQALKVHKGTPEVSSDVMFRIKLNLSSCIALLATAESCIEYYFDDEAQALSTELDFCKKVSEVWRLGRICNTIRDVIDLLRDIAFEWQVELNRLEMFGGTIRATASSRIVESFSVFATPIFQPLQEGIRVLSPYLQVTEKTAWLLCIDEAEWMSEDQQKTINSFMRVAPERLFIKMATMPFCHYTLQTNNAQTEVKAGDDFEYINMDSGGTEATHIPKDVKCGSGESVFADLLFARVIKTYYPEMNARDSSLEEMFGRCEILDNDMDQDWSNGSLYMKLLEKYGNGQLVNRAKSMLEMGGADRRFMDSVARKVRGALLLRDNKEKIRGNGKSELYSGAKMIVRCSDGNPRLFIRILNSLITLVNNGQSVEARRQEGVLVSLGENFLNQIKSYQNIGPTLYVVARNIGNQFKDRFYSQQLGSDVVGSFEIDEPSAGDNDAKHLLQVAIQYGILKPNNLDIVKYGAKSPLAGRYHLSYIFSPYFRMLPRKGYAVHIRTIMDFKEAKSLPVSTCLDENSVSNEQMLPGF